MIPRQNAMILKGLIKVSFSSFPCLTCAQHLTDMNEMLFPAALYWFIHDKGVAGIRWIDLFYCAGTCDLYHGEWVFDSSGALYTNNSCPVITRMQNWQGNGRPYKDYESWRWKPQQCTLPRFDGIKFLELMRGKTLAFVGDSVARNHMESLLCILWQVRYFTDTINDLCSHCNLPK